MHRYNLISILIPTLSIVLISLAFIFIKPQTTGLVISIPNETTQEVDADVVIITKSTEIIPADAVVEVVLDDKKAQMSLKEFIKKTNLPFQINNSRIIDLDYIGNGFTGDYTYKLPLSAFSIDRNIERGGHDFIVRLLYKEKVLYEKQNSIMI